MEHIRTTIAENAGTESESLRVVGVANEVLRDVAELRAGVTAVAWQPPAILLRATSTVAAALARQKTEAIRQQMNDLLRQRYGRPQIERLTIRLATEQ